MNTRAKRLLAIPVGALVAWAAFALAGETPSGLGGLNPPDGPVMDTSPSLAELGAQLEALEAKIDDLQSGPPGSGPYEVLYYNVEGSNSVAVEILPGRNWIHSVTAARTAAFLFDGPGQASSSPIYQPTSGSLVSALVALGDTTVATSVLDVIVEDGLSLSKFELGGTTPDYLLVYYQPLPEQP